MGATFRRPGDIVEITPTAALEAGTVVQIGAGLVGVTTAPIAANATGYANTRGEYDVDVTAGTAYDVGDLVPTAAKDLGGNSTTVFFGPALAPVTTTDTVARVRLVGDKKIIEDSTGGTAGTELVAPASTTYTTAELLANFATLAAAINA